MKKINFNYSLASLAFILLLTVASCKKPSNDDTPGPLSSGPSVTTSGSTDRIIYVINEGNYGSSNGSVNLYNPRTNVASNDIFKANNNNRSLGDVVQSMTLINGYAFFVVNNSNKIEITHNRTMESKAVINGLSMPRYIVQVSGTKAYVSEYVSYSSNGRVSIIDLTSNTVTGSINVGYLPENMVYINNKLYVTNSGENTVSVINTSTDAVETTITTTTGPNGIKLDNSGKVWVLCGGDAYAASPVAGAMVRINPVTNSVEQTYTFASATASPYKLCVNGSKTVFYFLYSDKVYSFNVATGTTSSSPVVNRQFYGLGIDPVEDKIYAGTYGFTSNQQLIRYSTSGTPLDSVTVGVGTNGFVF